MAIIELIKRRITTGRDLRTRLWRAGGLLVVFMLTMFVCNCVIPKDRAVTWDMLGHDFLAFYYGGNCARTGHYEQLYDLPATREFEFKTGHAAGLSLGKSFGPWWNPPFAAWMFAPLSALPYLTALHVWWTIGLISLAISIYLMCRMLDGGWKTKLLVPLLICPMMPCFQAFCHGQNTYVSLLLLTITVTLWRAGRSVLAGLVCGLMFYKPQLGALVAVVLVLSQGRRAMLGVCLTGTALVLVNMLTMPGTMHEFAYNMPLNMQWIQEQIVYRWSVKTTSGFHGRQFRDGAWARPRCPVCNRGSSGTRGVLAGLAMLDFLAMPCWRSGLGRDRLISAAIIAMPLLMPFYFDYDLLLLAVGVVVLAADMQRTAKEQPSPHREDRWLVGVLATVYIGLEFTMLLYDSRIHPIVPLLSFSTVLLIRRGLRSQAATAMESQPIVYPTALAA